MLPALKVFTPLVAKLPANVEARTRIFPPEATVIVPAPEMVKPEPAPASSVPLTDMELATLMLRVSVVVLLALMVSLRKPVAEVPAMACVVPLKVTPLPALLPAYEPEFVQLPFTEMAVVPVWAMRPLVPMVMSP